MHDMEGVSAEWVVEDYNGGYAKNHSRAFFTPIQFTQCFEPQSDGAGGSEVGSRTRSTTLTVVRRLLVVAKK